MRGRAVTTKAPCEPGSPSVNSVALPLVLELELDEEEELDEDEAFGLAGLYTLLADPEAALVGALLLEDWPLSPSLLRMSANLAGAFCIKRRRAKP